MESMTTAEAVRKAREARARCDWAEVAKYYDLAADNHPGHNNPHGLRSIDKLAIDNFRQNAESARATAEWKEREDA